MPSPGKSESKGTAPGNCSSGALPVTMSARSFPAFTCGMTATVTSSIMPGSPASTAWSAGAAPL